MPWSIERRDGRYCVVKQGEQSPVPGGCHDSRADAIKHQRALYVAESRTAALYQELDEIVAEPAIPETAPEPEKSSELVKIIVGENAMTASALEAISERQDQIEQLAQAMVAAVQAMAERQPVVNVEAPNVTVEPAAVTVQAPNVQVEAPQVTVQPAAVHVSPEIVVSPERRSIKFERDPQSQRLVGAVIEEEDV